MRGPLLLILASAVLAGCQKGPVEHPPGVDASTPVAAASGRDAARDTLPFDESEIVKSRLRYGSFHVAADSARALVDRSLGVWAGRAVWRKESVVFDYRDSIQVMGSEGAHPMWVLGSRPSAPVTGWTMSLDVGSEGFEGERKVLGGLRAAGWVEDAQYSADGPDGSILALVSEEAICRYAASWDGGDESDSTSAPAAGMSIRLQCVPRFPVRRGPLVTSR